VSPQDGCSRRALFDGACGHGECAPRCCSGSPWSSPPDVEVEATPDRGSCGTHRAVLVDLLSLRMSRRRRAVPVCRLLGPDLRAGPVRPCAPWADSRASPPYRTSNRRVRIGATSDSPLWRGWDLLRRPGGPVGNASFLGRGVWQRGRAEGPEPVRCARAGSCPDPPPLEGQAGDPGDRSASVLGGWCPFLCPLADGIG
jgi:hypothetical protein